MVSYPAVFATSDMHDLKWGEPERESSEQLDTMCSVFRHQLRLLKVGQSSKLS